MKLPRNAKLLRSQLDMAPFAGVFFLLLIFLMLGALVPTPGLPIHLPSADDLPGVDKPTVTVAVGVSNQLIYANQIVSETALKIRLREAVQKSAQPLTLVVRADESMTTRDLFRLTSLAREAGIQDALLATQPRPVSAPRTRASAPP